MSWIVQHLLKNSELIKTTSDISSDEYNNLVLLESKIDELHKKGMLSDRDLRILGSISDGSPISALEESVGNTRLTISRAFVAICNRIAYALGGYFTDEGFLSELQRNYHLAPADMEKVKKYMESRFKHKLIRKGSK